MFWCLRSLWYYFHCRFVLFCLLFLTQGYCLFDTFECELFCSPGGLLWGWGDGDDAFLHWVLIFASATLTYVVWSYSFLTEALYEFLVHSTACARCNMQLHVLRHSHSQHQGSFSVALQERNGAGLGQVIRQSRCVSGWIPGSQACVAYEDLLFWTWTMSHTHSVWRWLSWHPQGQNSGGSPPSFGTCLYIDFY